MQLFLLLLLSVQFHTQPAVKDIDQQQKSTTLNYLVRTPKVATEHPPVLILLHGVGSNAEDLFRYANSIDERFLVISAQGPYTLGAGRFAWYEVNFSNGKPTINPQQAENSKQALLQFIDEVVAKYNADPKQVYLMGFSQGAIMSLSIGLTHPEKVAGIAPFSGRTLQETRDQIQPGTDYSQLRVFLAHGTIDNMLPFHYANESKALLDELEINTTFKSYPIGHGISMEEFTDFQQWLVQ
tara:strand:+ start:3064 stop:3783 length:720 start_codon:yes stop_codon:yes gene_type:complete